MTVSNADQPKLSTDAAAEVVDYAGPQTEGSFSPEETYAGFTRGTWIRIGTIAALFAAVFWPNLRRLWLKTNPINGEPNWGHAVCVPVIGLYYLYIHREELLKAKVEPLLALAFTRQRWISAACLIGAGAALFLVG